MVRVDLLLDEATGELFVNEVNSIPGAMSLYLWAPQVKAAEVLKDALIEARDARPVVPTAGFGSGAALRAWFGGRPRTRSQATVEAPRLACSARESGEGAAVPRFEKALSTQECRERDANQGS